MQVEEAVAWGEGEPGQVGAPHSRRSLKPVGGEKGCNGGPIPCAPLNNDALLLWCPRLPLQTFVVVELLTPVPSGCLCTANSCPLPGSMFQTPLYSTQPPSTTGDTQLRLGCVRLRHRPWAQFSLCPAFRRLSAVFSFDPLKVSFCPSWFPHCEGGFLSGETSPHLQLPARVAGPFFDSSFLFSFFRPTWLWGDFSCPFRCLKSSTNVQQVLWKLFHL